LGKELSVVIPLLNEEALLAELVRQVKSHCETFTEDFEIILIDDGSIDDTWMLIEKEGLNDPRIQGIQFSRNFGHHYAITAGLDFSVGEWVVVMDGDLQDKPEMIPKLYRKALEGYDVVFVSRRNRPEKFYYKLAQKLFYWALKFLSGINFDSSEANFSIINRVVVNAFKQFPENARFYGSTIKWLGFKRTSIPADHGKRFAGTTSYTIRRRFNLAFDIIIAFSNRPLKAAIIFGLAMSVFSVLLTFWILYIGIIQGFTVSGWASLISTIIFSTGVLLIVLGVVGIYLGRIFTEVKSRPLYIISKRSHY
jgi:glycosyltransferase involved in cell wall biosynthesis